MEAFGSLVECLTDADRESRGRARSLRGRSMATAVAIEAALVAALLIWPLMHLGVLGQAPELLPKPLFFAPQPAPIIAHPGTTTSARSPLNFPILNFRPAVSAHPSQGTSNAEVPPGFGAFGDMGPSEGFIDLGDGRSAANLPPPHPAATRPPRVSVGVMDAMLVQRIDPEYPKIAQAMRLAGTVRLHAIIGTDGSVRDLQVTEGNPILSRAALAAVRQWRYRPTMLNGAAVEVETYVTVQFVLQ